MRVVHWKYLFLFVLLGLHYSTHAQYVCGTDEMHRRLIANNPVYKRTVELQTKKWQQYNKEKSLRATRPLVAPGDSLVIPIVIHVVHSGQPLGTSGNMSDDQLKTMIAKLNAIFSGNYTDQIVNTFGSPTFQLGLSSPKEHQIVNRPMASIASMAEFFQGTIY